MFGARKKEVMLRVEDPDPSHVGRNIITLDKRTKEVLGVTSGDLVEIEGSKKTAAVIWPARTEDEGKAIIRMDNLIRNNSGVGLGEKVTVRKALFVEAKRVVLAPTQEVRIIASGYDRILKKNFIGRPLNKGDHVWISVFGSGFVYKVVDTFPKGIVKITDFTQFILKEEPVKEDISALQKIAYEDIGGLEEQIQKIREMIELPMRHPEIFRKLGINPPKGVLLHGPPGTGKTLLAKAVANETQAHFIAINSPGIMCVGGNTRILTNPSGKKKISEMFYEEQKKGKIVNNGNFKTVKLKKPGKVFSLDKNFKIKKGKITHITKLKAQTYRLKTGVGETIICSENHPLACLDSSGNIAWKTAKELSKKDLVAIAKNLPKEVNEKNVPAKDYLAQKKFKEITKQFPKNSLKKIVNADVSWTTIDSVKAGAKEELFDLTVNPYSNFLAGNSLFVMHNSKFVGEAEERIRSVFKEAEKNAPSIIFFDEIDSIAPKRDEVIGEVERRVVAQILSAMDGMEARGNVIVIAATNRVNSIDEALRRPGRFDREIDIGVPTKSGRHKILQIHTRGMPLAKDIDLNYFARITHGFVGADLESLVKESAMKALRRYLPKINLEEETIPVEILEKLEVNKKDFIAALRDVQPSALREVTIEIPNVKWSDVGGIENAKKEIKQAVEWPLKHPEEFKKMGITPPRGILLYGPSGTGKTLLAKAVATESEANFISVKGPQLISLWVGESERAIRKVFARARQVSPVIVFFDEIDAVASNRGSHSDSGTTERTVNQLLTELDGVEELKDVVFIAATNRPDMIDPALLRPGRIDKLIKINAPKEEGRISILRVHSKKMMLSPEVSLEELAKKTSGYTGADLQGLLKEAALISLEKNKMKAVTVTKKDIEEALKKVKSSITKETVEAYEQFRESHGIVNPTYVR